MKVAVAGLGWWGKQIISCLDKSPRFEVLYGIDPKPPADVEEFRKSHKFTLDATLDKALADPAVEGVVLATPHALHEEQALRVIAAGKNLFCEKPLTMTGAGAKRVVEAAARPARCSASGTSGAGSRPSKSCGNCVDAGTLGKLLFFESQCQPRQFSQARKGQLAAQPGERPGRHDDRRRHPPHRSLHQHRRPRGRGARALDAA